MNPRIQDFNGSFGFTSDLQIQDVFLGCTEFNCNATPRMRMTQSVMRREAAREGEGGEEGEAGGERGGAGGKRWGEGG